MHGSQEIKKQNQTAVNERYQAQYKGSSWHVYDSHTNGWGGSTFARASDAQQAADALNAT